MADLDFPSPTHFAPLGSSRNVDHGDRLIELYVFAGFKFKLH